MRVRSVAMTRLGLIAALALGALVGCGGGNKQATASEPCVTAMQAAAAEPDSAKATPLITATLTACGTADEWQIALRQHPAAMGLTSRAVIGNTELQVSCWHAPDSPVCVDALASGQITGN